MIWHWNWFCSCHGKTDECDAGGGAFKRAIDGLELSGVLGAFFDHALAIVKYSQEKLRHPRPEQPDVWFFNGGKGVFRRWYHHIPARGRHSINRQISKAKDGKNITLEKNSITAFPISSMHRANEQQHVRVPPALRNALLLLLRRVQERQVHKVHCAFDLRKTRQVT
jgi:hypothetical protein